MSNLNELSPDGNEIKMFFHCVKCLAEKSEDISPRDWAQLEAGWTEQGFQVWCKRHECNVILMNFEGHKHPADTSADYVGRRQLKLVSDNDL